MAKDKGCLIDCLTTRRQFLLASGVATAAVFFPGIPGFRTGSVEAVVAKYPRQRIGRLSDLKQDAPVFFDYPSAGIKNMLVKLGAPAGGGVGPMKDVIAFNPVCTHRGGQLDKVYRPEYKVLGQCPLHQTTFDLTRHGIVVSGHATQSLPQIELELEGDDIFATGIIGLVYGRNSNV